MLTHIHYECFQVVLCNQTLLDILLKSGQVQSVEELLKQKTVKARERVLLSSLTEEEILAIQ